MNYEEKYKQALERAMKLAIDGYLDAIAIDDIFPELKESEDERTRKKLISFVENWKKYNPNSPFDDYAVYTSDRDELDKILAWLEKQGKALDPDRVIEWMKTHGNLWPRVTIKINEVIDKFKQDFDL